MTEQEKDRNDSPSELVLGLVTFVIFIIFMTVWMYFNTSQ